MEFKHIWLALALEKKGNDESNNVEEPLPWLRNDPSVACRDSLVTWNGNFANNHSIKDIVRAHAVYLYIFAYELAF